jgi:hypothetical protein
MSMETEDSRSLAQPCSSLREIKTLSALQAPAWGTHCHFGCLCYISGPIQLTRPAERQSPSKGKYLKHCNQC